MKIKNPPAFVPRGMVAAVHYFEGDGHPGTVIVTLTNHESQEPIAVAGILVHEAVHVWQTIKAHIREPEPSREFEAYSIQMISQKLMWAYQDLIKQNGN